MFRSKLGLWACRVFKRLPPVGSVWRRTDNPPWTFNVWTVTRAEQGWVEVEQGGPIKGHTTMCQLKPFYNSYVPDRPSEATKAARMAARLNGTSYPWAGDEVKGIYATQQKLTKSIYPSNSDSASQTNQAIPTGWAHR